MHQENVRPASRMRIFLTIERPKMQLRELRKINFLLVYEPSIIEGRIREEKVSKSIEKLFFVHLLEKHAIVEKKKEKAGQKKKI